MRLHLSSAVGLLLLLSPLALAKDTASVEGAYTISAASNPGGKGSYAVGQAAK